MSSYIIEKFKHETDKEIENVYALAEADWLFDLLKEWYKKESIDGKIKR